MLWASDGRPGRSGLFTLQPVLCKPPWLASMKDMPAGIHLSVSLQLRVRRSSPSETCSFCSRMLCGRRTTQQQRGLETSWRALLTSCRGNLLGTEAATASDKRWCTAGGAQRMTELVWRTQTGGSMMPSAGRMSRCAASGCCDTTMSSYLPHASSLRLGCGGRP